MRIKVEESPFWNNRETIQKISEFTGKVVDVHSQDPLILVIEEGRKRDLKALKNKKLKIVVLEGPKETREPHLLR